MSAPSLSLVLAQPGDLGPRLALADALAASGDPRADLIRTQIATLGRLTPDQREAAAWRCQKLFEAHGAAWDAPVRGWAERRYRAGFIQAIRAKGAAFLQHAAALFAVEPVEEVTLVDVSDTILAALAALPVLSRVRRLVVRGGYSDAGAAQLVASPHLASLASLSLSPSDEGPVVVEAIAASQVRALSILSLTGSIIGNEGAVALAGAERLAGLTKLYLGGCDVGDEGVAAIAESPWLTSLSTLCLGGTDQLGDAGAKAIANGSALGKLAFLELRQTCVGQAGAEAIVTSQKLVSLRRLDLRQTDIGWKGRAALGKVKGIAVRF